MLKVSKQLKFIGNEVAFNNGELSCLMIVNNGELLIINGILMV